MSFTSRAFGLLLAAVAGLGLAAAFPDLGIWLLAPASVAAITWVQWRRSAWWGAITGLVFGLAFFLALMPWLQVIGTDAWIALSVYCAGWFAIQGALTARFSHYRGAILLIPAIWVVQEWLRGSVPFGGYPWGRLAFSQSEAATVNIAWWLGSYGLTYAVALCGALIAFALRTDRTRSAILAAAVAVGLVIAPQVLSPSNTASGTFTIAIVQGSTPQTGMGAMDVRRAVLDNHVNQTFALGRSIKSGDVTQPDLVLWPENASDIDPFTDAAAARAISDASAMVGAPILVGAVRDDPDDPTKRRNVGILWTDSPQFTYSKTRLVPFGEFIPFRDLIAQHIERFDRIPRDFAPGEVPGLFTVGDVIFGNAICFEVAYDSVMNTLVTSGAQFLTIQTNNATYANTSQIGQQLAIERLRSVESGRALAVAATTGASVIFGPDATELASIPIDGVGFAVAEIPLIDSTPPGARINAILPWIAAIAILLQVTIGFLTQRKREVRVG